MRTTALDDKDGGGTSDNGRGGGGSKADAAAAADAVAAASAASAAGGRDSNGAVDNGSRRWMQRRQRTQWRWRQRMGEAVAWVAGGKSELHVETKLVSWW